MGIILSICRRKHDTLEGLNGKPINVFEEFEEFNESDELLAINVKPNDNPPLKKSPYPKRKLKSNL
nr:myristylated tegument protein [Macronycteris gammaherpesvirus 1]